MRRWASIILAVSSALIVVNCQTFQYSRGWTNGKRDSNLANNLLEGSALSTTQLEGTGSQLANLQANCRLQKLKMLLQGNGNEQTHFLPCEFLNALGRSSEAQIVSYFRPRSLAENSSTNY